MSEYQLTDPATGGGTIIRTEDGASIPPDPANRDYQEYLKWVEDGGVPDPYVPPEPVPPVIDANARIDAGIMAALDVAIAVKLAMQNIPDHFTEQNVIAAKIQLDALTEAVVAMLQAQAAPPP